MTNSLLSLIESLRGEPIEVATLWQECGILRRNGATWPPQTLGQFNEQLRALERAGLVAVEGGVVRVLVKREPVQKGLF